MDQMARTSFAAELQDVREEFRNFGFIADQPKCCRNSDSTRSAP